MSTAHPLFSNCTLHCVKLSKAYHSNELFCFNFSNFCSIVQKVFYFLGIFFITVCPLQRTWASYAGLKVKQYIIQVIPWTYYNMIHSILFMLTLRNLDHDHAQFNIVFLVLYPVLFMYTCFKLFWLTFLGVQLTNSSLVPILYPPEADIQRLEEGLFEDMTNWTRDSKSEVVPGVELKFFRSILPDKSVIVCGTPGDRFRDIMKPLEANEILREELLREPELLPLMRDDGSSSVDEIPSLSYDPLEILQNLQDSANDTDDYPSIDLYSNTLAAATLLSDTDELIMTDNSASHNDQSSSTVVEYDDDDTTVRRRRVVLQHESA